MIYIWSLMSSYLNFILSMKLSFSSRQQLTDCWSRWWMKNSTIATSRRSWTKLSTIWCQCNKLPNKKYWTNLPLILSRCILRDQDFRRFAWALDINFHVRLNHWICYIITDCTRQIHYWSGSCCQKEDPAQPHYYLEAYKSASGA